MNGPTRQGSEPETGLSHYHRRCLDKQIDECNDALAQAVRALCKAEAWEPSGVSLHALCGLLQAARSLSETAHEMSVQLTGILRARPEPGWLGRRARSGVAARDERWESS